jgi:hypothetical protein
MVVITHGPPPGWVDHLPKKKGELCAVGYSGPTFYQPDCIKNAAENARGHLAESITVTIRTVTMDISDGSRGSFSRDTFVQGSESAAEAVLQGSEIQSQWVDHDGSRGDSKGCYALVCIDPDKPIEKMVEKLEEKLPPKTVEKVRANAEAAFDELEKAEAAAADKKMPTIPITGKPSQEVKPEEVPTPTPQKTPTTTPEETSKAAEE